MVLDTNVLISATLFPRSLPWLRNAWYEGAFILTLTPETFAELERVIAYPKF